MFINQVLNLEWNRKHAMRLIIMSSYQNVYDYLADIQGMV